jgi:hypothetical protein
MEYLPEDAVTGETYVALKFYLSVEFAHCYCIVLPFHLKIAKEVNEVVKSL